MIAIQDLRLRHRQGSMWVRHPAKTDSTLTPAHVLIYNLGSSGPERVDCEFRSVVPEFGNAVFNLDSSFLIWIHRF